MDQQCPVCKEWVVWAVAPGLRWVPADRRSFIDCGISLDCGGDGGPPFRTGLGHVDHRNHCSWKPKRPPPREDAPREDASARNDYGRDRNKKPPDRNDPDTILAAAPMQELYLLPGAPPTVVKAAYRALVLLRHPDRGGSEEAMKRLNAAYERLQKLGRAPK